MTRITASVVTYHNNSNELSKVINSVLESETEVDLYIIDNSRDDKIRKLCESLNVYYFHSKRNLGFGKGHNIAITKVLNESTYHVVLNPDVYFDKGVFSALMEYIDDKPDIALISPKVMFPDNSLQRHCRLLPRPQDLIYRRMNLHFGLFNNIVDQNELANSNYNLIQEVPAIHGCFLLFRTAALKEVGLFDERYFMYMEDLDICRRISTKFKVVLFPNVHIYHGFNRESSRSFKMLVVHLKSIWKYFNKWGWFQDQFRKHENKKFLKS